MSSHRPHTPLLVLLAAGLLLVTGLAPGVSTPATAQDPVREGTPASELPPPTVPLTQLLLDGWTMVAPNVLQREIDGRTQTLALGTSGLEWEAQLLEDTADRLEFRYQVTADPDLLDEARELREEAARTRELAAERRGDADAPDGFSAEALVSCTLTTSYTAEAFPTLCGPRAEATADFSDTCGSFGDTFGQVYAEGFLGASFRYEGMNDLDDGNGAASIAVSADVTADNDCFSSAYARVRLYDDFGGIASYIIDDQNTTCRENLTVGISGPTAISIPAFSCTLVTWTATPSDPVTSYSWTWNNAPVGSSSSYTRGICWTSALAGTTQFEALGVSVSQACQTASAGRLIQITYGSNGPCNDPFCPQEELD